MKTHLTLRTLVIAVAALLVATLGGTDARADEPKVGDKAPDFTLVGSDGKEYALSQLIGKRTVVLAWFPKAFTGGCTAECKSMKETGAEIRNFDVAYFTASVDEPEKNADFAKSLGLDYPILSDPSKKVATAYGVVHEGRLVAERWTFYIGIDGKIKAIDKQVNTKEAGHDIASKLEALGVAKK